MPIQIKVVGIDRTQHEWYTTPEPTHAGYAILRLEGKVSAQMWAEPSMFQGLEDFRRGSVNLWFSEFQVDLEHLPPDVKVGDVFELVKLTGAVSGDSEVTKDSPASPPE